MSAADAAAVARAAALADRAVPADAWPSGGAAMAAHLALLASEPTGAATVARVLAAVDGLDDAARRAHGRPAAELDEAALRRLLARRPDDTAVLVDAAAQAYYGGADRPGAAMVGFEPGPTLHPLGAVGEPVIPLTAFAALPDTVDVVVLGAGAGGGVAACVLAEAGLEVLVVDRGEHRRRDEVGRDHLRTHRLSLHGHNTGPGPDAGPRVVVGADGRERRVDDAHELDWHNTAMGVGGGTAVYQGMAWRFLPEDFRMATTHGVPDGSSLADWPITYDELEPHYAWAEWALGVCGDGAAHRAQGPRSRPYPMPALPPTAEAEVLAVGAAAEGLRVGPVPLLLNSVPRDGRARCVRCGECVGFTCPVGARNGTLDTVLPRALATGRCRLVPGARAIRVRTDAAGRVSGVVLVDEHGGATHEVSAGDVVVACGAIETARLLLASRSRHHPHGLGNATDQVGRHLQGHCGASAYGRFDDVVQDMAGPGVAIATCDAIHGDADADGPLVGGGVIANEVVKVPMAFWYGGRHPGAPTWGLEGKAAWRDAYRRTSHLFSQVQEVPLPGNRVTLADGVVDRHGVPVARLAGGLHPETLRARRRMEERARRWMAASGARQVWSAVPPSVGWGQPGASGLTAGHHQAGTCRMGDDPARSVTGPDGRVHGHDNLWVADASLHVTNGGVNPVLTVYALAHRTATAVAAARR